MRPRSKFKPEINLSLPLPPSVNSYWRHRVIKNKNGKLYPMVYVSKQGKDFQKAVRRIVRKEKKNKKLLGRLDIHIYVTLPDRRKRDIDNYLKALLDAMEKADVYVNDNQVDRILIDRGDIEKPGHVDVSIKPMRDIKMINPRKLLRGNRNTK